MVITYNMSMDQPGKVIKPARGQLNRENEVPLLFAMLTLNLRPCTFMDSVVPTDMAIHQVSMKHGTFHVFILYGYMYVTPQDESC